MPSNPTHSKQTKRIPRTPSKPPPTSCPIQYFSLDSEERQVGIATVPDPITKRPCILWQDIQNSFPRLSHIRAGREHVFCVFDENLVDAEPRRIRYYPNMKVLTVFEEKGPSISPPSPQSSLTSPTEHTRFYSAAQNHSHTFLPFPLRLPLNPKLGNRDIHASVDTDDSVSQASSPASLSHRDDETFSYEDDDVSLHTPLTDSSDTTPPSRIWPRIDLPVDIPLFVKQLDIRRHLEPYLAKLGPQGEEMIRLYDQLFTDHATVYCSENQSFNQLERLTELMEEQNKTFIKLVTQQLAEENLEDQKRNEEALVRERLQMMRLDGLNRLAILKAAQSVATQAFKLQEKTSPRLFIVLPKEVDERDHARRADLVESDFRLYFLCECEAQTEEDESAHVHLAQHKGYDLLRHDEFFSIYGSYALTMLEMVKYGVVSENFVVPSLMTFKLLDGTEGIKGYGNTRRNIQSKVDEAIHFLRSRLCLDQGADNQGMRPIERHSLSTDDLLRLESFLVKQRDGRLLGHLRRSVSSDDVVQWVCSDHSPHRWIERKIARAAKRKERLSFKCCSPAEIAHFCDVLEGSPSGLKALDVSVPWKASEHEIQSLCDAVLAAGVSSIAFHGVVFSSLAEDAAIRGDPLKPILQLQAAIGNPQFSLTGTQLLSSIQEHDKSPISGLRKLNVNLKEFSTIMKRKLSFFLQRLPDLTELSLNTDNLVQGYMFLLDHQHHLPCLSTATLSSDGDEAIYYPSSRTLRLSELAVQFDEIIKRDKTLVKITVPFNDDFAMCDIRALDPIYRHRQTPLVAEFVNDKGTVVEVEYRSLNEAVSEQYLDGRLRCIGEQSVMYLRVLCDKYLAAPDLVHYMEPDVAWILPDKDDRTHSSQPCSKATLDFPRLNLFGVPAVLESLSVTEVDALRLITCAMHWDLRWLALARLKAVSWSKLSRLEVRGTSLVDWMQRFPFIFKRDSMDSLQELCVAGNGQMLSSRCASWIEAIVKSHPSQEALRTIMLHDVNLGEEEWDSLANAIDLSRARTLQLTGSSLQQGHFETMLDRLPFMSPLESVCLRNVPWAQSLDGSDRADLLLKLRIKARAAVILFE
ncbi:hypothetical protein BGX34_000199 [Mortierella sp. NVP85]|nr:hypothetical protein BGX34_000199 [Mortierella sp. NVP85]